MDINKIKKSGKIGLADALVEIEKNPFDKKSPGILPQTTMRFKFPNNLHFAKNIVSGFYSKMRFPSSSSSRAIPCCHFPGVP